MAITLQDITAGMQRLKEREQREGTQERISLEELRQMAGAQPGVIQPKAVETLTKQVQDASNKTHVEQTETNDRLDKVEDLLQKGLLDTKGDGINSNIMKMTAEMRKAFAKKEAVRVEKESKESAEKYMPTAREYIQGKLIDKVKPSGQYVPDFKTAVKEKVKETFSLKGMFDLSEGKSQGLLGQMVRRAVDKKEFVKTMVAANPQMKTLKQFRDESGKFDPKTLNQYFSQRYENIQNVRGQQQSVEKQIAEYETKGLTTQEVGRTGLLKKRRELDAAMAKADPRYAKRREQARAEQVQEVMSASEPSKPKRTSKSRRWTEADVTNPMQSFVAATGTSKEKAAAPLEAVTSFKEGLVGPQPITAEETDQEHMRLVGEQTEALHNIDQNTAGLTETLGKVAAAVGAIPAAAAAPEAEGGGILSSIADMLDLGGLGKKAKGAAGKAVGNLGKLGKVAKIGGGLLAAAGGAYTAYQGWSSASEEEDRAHAQIDEAVKTGQISPTEASTIKAKVTDEADVKKGEAAGEGGGMVAGAAMGASVGTMIGGPVGTVVGGAIGAFAGSEAGKAIGGGVVSAYKGVKNWFTGDKETDKNKAEPLTRVVMVQPVVMGSTQLQQAEAAVGGVKTSDAIVAADSMTGGGVKQQMGLTQAGVERAGGTTIPTNARQELLPVTAAAPTPQAAEAVYQQSAENKAAETSAPVVINAPTISAPTISNQTSTQYAIRSPARNSESSQQNYNRSRFAY